MFRHFSLCILNLMFHIIRISLEKGDFFMRKLQDVIGLPVLDIGSGKNIGVVKDLYFNQKGELKGLALEKEGFFKKIHFLSFEDVGSIGDDAVTISSKDLLTPLHENDQYYSFQLGKNIYKELPVITTNGHELGHIKDVYFMEEVGKIIGYEISDGFLSDITEGRRTIKVPQKLIIGEDAMIVPKNEINEIHIDQE